MHAAGGVDSVSDGCIPAVPRLHANPMPTHGSTEPRAMPTHGMTEPRAPQDGHGMPDHGVTMNSTVTETPDSNSAPPARLSRKAKRKARKKKGRQQVSHKRVADMCTQLVVHSHMAAANTPGAGALTTYSGAHVGVTAEEYAKWGVVAGHSRTTAHYKLTNAPEHTTSKFTRGYKLIRHERGIAQRANQRKRALRRLQKHGFSFRRRTAAPALPQRWPHLTAEDDLAFFQQVQGGMRLV